MVDARLAVHRRERRLGIRIDLDPTAYLFVPMGSQPTRADNRLDAACLAFLAHSFLLDAATRVALHCDAGMITM
jgi:hypothetical protein